MTRKVLVELARAFGTVVLAALLLLVGLELAPGSPADLVPDPAVSDVLTERWGLDGPVALRAVRWFGGLLSGDLGTSLAYRPGAPVWEVLRGPLWQTTWLVGLAAPLAIAFSALSRRAHPVILTASALPVFLAAHLAIEAVNTTTWAAIGAGWLARPEWFALPGTAHPVRLLLAAACLAIGSNLAGELTSELGAQRDARRRSPFAAVARVHGTAGPGWRHTVADALPVLSARLPMLLGGAVITERVFLMNGAGAVLWEAALLRDFELAMGIAFGIALIVAGWNLLAELGRAVLDPRAREVL